jgi:hypothetical protein
MHLALGTQQIVAPAQLGDVREARSDPTQERWEQPGRALSGTAVVIWLVAVAVVALVLVGPRRSDSLGGAGAGAARPAMVSRSSRVAS